MVDAEVRCLTAVDALGVVCCPNRAAKKVTTGCEHEHIETGLVCDLDYTSMMSQHESERLWCTKCFDAGHRCAVVVLEVVDL